MTYMKIKKQDYELYFSIDKDETSGFGLCFYNNGVISSGEFCYSDETIIGALIIDEDEFLSMLDSYTEYLYSLAYSKRMF